VYIYVHIYIYVYIYIYIYIHVHILCVARSPVQNASRAARAVFSYKCACVCLYACWIESETWSSVLSDLSPDLSLSANNVHIHLCGCGCRCRCGCGWRWSVGVGVCAFGCRVVSFRVVSWIQLCMNDHIFICVCILWTDRRRALFVVPFTRSPSSNTFQYTCVCLYAREIVCCMCGVCGSSIF